MIDCIVRHLRVSRFGLLGLLLSVLSAGATRAAPEVDLHELRWFVHVDLIDVGAGRDLAYWTALIDESMVTASRLVEGAQGPADTPCCTRFTRAASVTTFGSTGDGLDVLDSMTDQNTIAGLGGAGSKAYLIDSLTYCGGFAPDGIGCAGRPACSGNAGDDPPLWMVATVEAWEEGVLGSVIAHERGHNACLTHVSTDECKLMSGSIFLPALGTCLDTTECTNMRAARTTTSSGLECGCHADGGGGEDDGASCAGAPSGVCSGALCASVPGDAGVHLLSAGGPDFGLLEPTDDLVRLSGLNGDWQPLGAFSPTSDEVSGLAWAHDAATLYGVVPSAGDDAIVTVDPDSGAILATVGTIANGSDELVAMAYDPGTTGSAADDRLLVLETDGSYETLFWIDPATPSTYHFVGGLPGGASDGLRGLAYDSLRQKLYTSSRYVGGLYEIGLASCPVCSLISLPGVDLVRNPSGLAFSRETGNLYLVGARVAGEPTLYNVVDPVTGEVGETIGVDAFTVGGLAARPVPEPGTAGAIAWGIATLVGLAGGGRRASDGRR